jgi:uncharacterized radical SAM superfamily Fe-S cluster-containing enzyme
MSDEQCSKNPIICQNTGEATCNKTAKECSGKNTSEEFIKKFELWIDEPNEQLINKTASLCPSCLNLIPMLIFKSEEKVKLRKTCPEHGTIEDIYWGDYGMFVKAKQFEAKGRGVENLHNPEQNPMCPKACGLCSLHETHTCLANITVTNRCDLTCWYCFFFAEKAGYIYEPTVEEIRKMVRLISKEKPIASNAVQLTGGNPEMRNDLVEIIKAIKEEGIEHVQINTNGTFRLWKDPEFAKQIREAGINTIYYSFDGVTAKANPKNFWETPSILENCRKAGLGIVLVPTIINTINDHEVGDILRFALRHIDIIRGVNYQPVSLVGRMPTEDRSKFRITVPDVIKRLEEQTGVPRSAFYPVPCTTIFSNFIEALSGKPRYDMTVNSACGMATYLFKDGDRIIPITEFVDIDGLFEYLKQLTTELKSGKSRLWIMAKLLKKIGSFIDKSKAPKGLDLAKIIYNVFVKKDYKALGEFHKKSLFVGLMHFQDLYNWDIERVKKCGIHYATEDGVIPFCTFNVIPQWYRDKIQKQRGEPIEQWQARTGIVLANQYRKLDPDFMKTLPGNLLDLPAPIVKSEVPKGK